jgi:hypothetical protein
MTVTLRGTTSSSLRLEFALDHDAQGTLETEVSGKRILFTDHVDWSIADVVGAYRSPWQVEADFRRMKDPSVVSFSPMFHWTEQKIRVHVFYCVLALTVARLRRATQRAAVFTSACVSSSRTSPEMKRPCCSSRTNEDAREPVTCSPIWTRSNGVSTTSSSWKPTVRSADLGTTPSPG